MESNWQTVKLESAPLEIIDGDRGLNYPTQSEFSTRGHCLFLNAGNVTPGGFDFSDCAFISLEKDARLRKGKLVRNDVVLTTRGTVGNSAYFDDSIPFDHIRINSGMIILRPQKQHLEPRYLYLFVRSQLFHSQVAALRTGSAQPQLPIRDINRIAIPLPPLSQQRAIAHVLGTLDDKIGLNRLLAKTLEAIMRTLFKSWFIDFSPVRAKIEGRDPGVPKHLVDLFPESFEDSELGEIPKGWKVGAIGNVAENLRRGVRPDQIDATEAYIALEHMPKRSIALSDWDCGKRLESTKFQFKRGDILFGKLRPYFHKVGVAPVDGVCSTDIVVVRSKLKSWFGFVLGHISSNEFIEYTTAGSTGTKMPRTNWSDMARYAVVLPPEPLVAAYSALLNPLVERVITSIHECRTLAKLHDTLLPKLISGELPIKDVGAIY